MRALLYATIGVLLAWPAAADMYPNASNAKLPEAINNLTTGGIPNAGGPGGSMANTGSGWWLPGWWGSRGGQNTQWLFGTKDAPITTAGSPVAIGIVQGKTAATCDGNSANTGCNSALLVQNMGTPATTMVTSGLTAYAETQSTSGIGTGNAQAGNFVAVASSGAQTGGLGLYAVGMRFGASGSAYGAEISSWNRTTTVCDPAQYWRISRCTALYLALRGPDAGPTTNISSAIQVIKGNDYGRAREGLVFNNGTVDEKTINDKSEADTVLNISGSHIHGITIEAPAAATADEPAYASVTSNSFNDLSSSARSVNIAGSHSNAAIWVHNGSGFFGLNTSSAPTALFHMGGTISVPAYTGSGALIRQALGGLTDTTSSGTVGAFNPVNMFEATTLSATNATTYTTAMTMYIKAPLAGSNVTITKAYALLTTGDVRIDGGLIVGPSNANVSSSELGLVKITASGTAPGAASGKIALVCGTGAGTGKLIAYGGTSTTPVTIADNIGGGITGC